MTNDLWRLRIITVVGFWVFLLPVLGFPRGLKSTLYAASGALIALLAFIVARSLAGNYAHHEEINHDHTI